MPNQRDPDKKLIGYQARKVVRDAVDDCAREAGWPDRATALENLLIEALTARGYDVSPEYRPDRVARVAELKEEYNAGVKKRLEAEHKRTKGKG